MKINCIGRAAELTWSNIKTIMHMNIYTYFYPRKTSCYEQHQDVRLNFLTAEVQGILLTLGVCGAN